MALEVVFFGIYLPLFAWIAWSRKRLLDVVDARHPETARTIYAKIRSLPRSQRWAERVSQYRKLPDPEVQARILEADRAGTEWGWAIIIPMGLGFVGWLIFLVISASR